MAGIIRWRDLQNVVTTEAEINLLSGLIVNGPQINRLQGFTGNGTDLNNAITMTATVNQHLIKDLSKAHPILTNSIDGGVLVDGTISKNKLSFIALDSYDKLHIDNTLGQIDLDLREIETQVSNLYGVLFPSVTGDIAQQFSQLVSHIEKLEDAHDATAISLGNQYSATSNAPTGAIQIAVGMDYIKFFKVGDQIELKDTNSTPEVRILTGVDYNGGQIGWNEPLLQDFLVVNSAIVTNLSQKNLQQGIERSLRNTTDDFSGRLRITQTTDQDALVINKTGPGYTVRFNDFKGKTALNFELDLGLHNDNSYFSINDNQGREAFLVSDQGGVVARDYTLTDRTSDYEGLITKQPLTADRTWTLPNRSGFIGIGDLTFTELLKVRHVQGTKSLTIAPGFMNDYQGERVSVWISMDKPCGYAGATIDIQAKMMLDNQLLTLGSQWQIITVYITDIDNVNFFYNPKRATKQEALNAYQNFIPSAYMKLAKVIVRGDGNGGVLQSSIEILEDQRPFLTMGMSASYYDETLTTTTGWANGTSITLPYNSKAGGIAQTYKVGRGQLEVYLDGVYQVVDQDYQEEQGEPIGRIRTLKDIPANSTLHFRITYTTAAVTGGFDVPTLQLAYNAGPSIIVEDALGPVRLTSFNSDLLLDIQGNVNITNKIFGLKAASFEPSNLLLDTDKNQIYVNDDAELVFHQYKSGVAKDYNLIKELDEAKTLIRMKMFNASGMVIPKGRAVALHPSMANAIVLCNTSNDLSTSRCIGVTLENINIGESGEVIISGLFKLTGLGITHNTVLVVDPRNPGLIVNKTSVNFLPTDKVVEVGVVDGGHLIVNIVNPAKNTNVWKVGVAGESFNANETRLVRFAVDGETRGRVYKADKANANLDQKFWVVAAVQPKVSVMAGDPIDLYKIVDIASSELAFDDQDIGKPLYLDSEGAFKPWRLLNGAFTTGDAAIKIGMIEDRRKFIIDGIQMMGTAPGPLFQ